MKSLTEKIDVVSAAKNLAKNDERKVTIARNVPLSDVIFF
jgi:hypothetical protein